jgi:2-C-methyl-D-erythritol 4-phosphate cytidylyltransferase
VYNGMNAVHDGAELVCIHDAARPLVTKECVYKVWMQYCSYCTCGHFCAVQATSVILLMLAAACIYSLAYCSLMSDVHRP